MSTVADFDRSTEGMRSLLQKVCHLCDTFFETVRIDDLSQTAELFKLYDMVLTQRSVLSAMLCSATAIGTHGSAFVDRLPDKTAGAIRANRTLTLGAASRIDKISEMPDPELWFETLLARKRG